MKLVIGLCVVAMCAACSAPLPRSHEPVQPRVHAFAEPVGGSLFSGDSTILSDADIERILQFQYRAPKQIRLAVLPFAHEYWFGYSDELAHSGNEVRSALLAQLKATPRVTAAAFLPSLLIPANRSVPFFREAAARYQADLLLIYKASSRTYEKTKLFRANTSKSFCNVEALLLDVRTGIVPFTTMASEKFLTTQAETDISFYETMRKAELSAIGSALIKVGDAVSDFLKASN